MTPSSWTCSAPRITRRSRRATTTTSKNRPASSTSSRKSNNNVKGVLLDDVSVDFDGVAALSDVTLQIEAGEQLAVIGASGAGKSTLFRALTRSVALGSGRGIGGGRALPPPSPGG